MAARARRLDSNSPGDFYVDETCIDCGTCRWLAPATFDAEGERSRVHRQPARERDVAQARLALLACPVSAIGTETKHDLREARAARYLTTACTTTRSTSRASRATPRRRFPLMSRGIRLSGIRTVATHSPSGPRTRHFSEFCYRFCYRSVFGASQTANSPAATSGGAFASKG